MEAKYFLLIDIGTGNSIVALGSDERKLIDTEKFFNEYREDKDFENSLVFNPDELIEKIMIAIKKLLNRNEKCAKSIKSIICDSPRQSFVFLDKCGGTILGIPNVDNRGKNFLYKFEDKSLKEKVYTKSGHPLTEDFGALKLVATRERQETKYKYISHMTSVSEWIGYVFTEKLSIEYSHAAETQLFNISENKWDEELCGIFGIDSKILPEIVQSGSVLGDVKSSILNRLGINKKIKFLIGGADTQIALESISSLGKDDIFIVSGTTSPVIKLDNEPYFDYENNIWNGKHCKGSRYMVEANPGVTGLNYQNFKKIFADDISYDELEEMYRGIHTPRIISNLTSQIVSQKNIKGGFFLFPPNSNDISKVDFMYSILCDNVCAIFRKFKMLNIDNVFEIKCCGGGFQSEAFIQNLTNLIGIPLKLEEGFEESSLYGLLNISMKAQGSEIKDDVKKKKVYYPTDNSFIKIYYENWLKCIGEFS